MVISKKLRSIYWILLRYTFYTLGMATIKYVKKENIIIIIFFKYFFSFLILSPYFSKNSLKIQKKNYKLFFILILLLTFTIPLTYYGYRHTDLSLATSVSFLSPLFIAAFASGFLKENTSYSFWILIIIGYLGIIIMIWPINFKKSSGISALLLANIFASLIFILKKKLSESQNSQSILFIQYTSMIFISGIFFAFYNSFPKIQTIFIIFLASILSVIGQYSSLRAMRLSPASQLAPFEYSRIVLSIPIGMYFFNEKLTGQLIFGSIIVILSNFFVSKIKIKSN